MGPKLALCFGAFLLLSLLPHPARAAPDKTAFIDGGSVSIGTGETTLATLSPSFPAGKNFVIAIVQFQSTADVTITPGNLVLQRTTGTPRTLMSNFYNVRMSTGVVDRYKWYALMGIDDAGSSPSYAVKVLAASATGASGEAKILAIGGVPGTEAQSASEITIQTSETILCTFEPPGQTLPAGDNIVLALFETHNTHTTQEYNVFEYLKRAGVGLPLASTEYFAYHGYDGTYGDWQVQLMPFYDPGVGENPTYRATAVGDSNKVKGVAKIVAFNRGSLSAAYSDGGSTALDTSEKIINTLSTSFASGSEAVVIASEQFASTELYIKDIGAGANELHQNNEAGTRTSNQYMMRIREVALGDSGEGFGLLNRFTSIPASPTYRVNATANAGALNGEAKILAIVNGPTFWESYSDPQRTTICNLFSSSDTAYMMARDLTSGSYRVRYYDGNDNLVATNDKSHTGGHLNDSQSLSSGSAGTWHARLYNITGTETLLSDDTFTLQSPVPEFPVGILVLLLPVTATYLYLRRRSDRGPPTHVKRISRSIYR